MASCYRLGGSGSGGAGDLWSLTAWTVVPGLEVLRHAIVVKVVHTRQSAEQLTVLVVAEANGALLHPAATGLESLSERHPVLFNLGERRWDVLELAKVDNLFLAIIIAAMNGWSGARRL